MYVQNKRKGNKAKTKSMKPKLLKTLPVGTLISFIGTSQLGKLRKISYNYVSHYVMITYFFAPVCMFLLRSFLT